MPSLLFRYSGIALLAALGVSAPPQSAVAQTREECRQAVQGATENAREAVRRGFIVRCGAEGQRALALLVRDAASEQDTAQLERLTTLASYVDQGVFDAASSLASNQSASPQSRIAGLRILAQQVFGPGSTIVTMAGERGWFVVDSLAPCYATHVARPTIAPGGVAIANGPALLRSLSERIARDGSEPSLVRNAARCDRNGFGSPLAPRLSASSFRLGSICDTRFVITSLAPIPATFTWAVIGTTASGVITANPRSSTTFYTLANGVVQLSYDGTLVATASSSRKRCRP